jgi:hypothetical protein
MSDFFSYQTAAEPPRGRAAKAGTAAPAMPPQWVLQELSPEDWEHVLRFAARRRHGAGSAVVALGAAEPALHLIASGRCGSRPRASRRSCAARAKPSGC